MKVSKTKDISCGIPMEYIREIKFFTELGLCNHPNILKVRAVNHFNGSSLTVTSKTTVFILFLRDAEAI